MRRPVGALSIVLLVLSFACASTGSKPRDPGQQGNPSLHAFNLQNEGAGYFRQGRYELALQKFNEADKAQPGNATVHNMIGICLLRLKQYDQAIAAFTKALVLTPALTDARNNRGATYLEMGKYQLAEVDFTAVLADSTYPHRWQAFYNLGMTYLQRGQLAQAEENLKRAATAQAPVFDAFLRLADIARQMNKTDDAIRWLEEARLKFPERMEANLQLGQLLLEAKREDEAKTYLQQVITTDPNSDLARQAQHLLETLG